MPGLYVHPGPYHTASPDLSETAFGRPSRRPLSPAALGFSPRLGIHLIEGMAVDAARGRVVTGSGDGPRPTLRVRKGLVGMNRAGRAAHTNGQSNTH